MRRVRWAFRARRDFIEITDHYAATAPHFPFDLLAKINRITEALTVQPGLGPKLTKRGYHKTLVSGTKYLLLYRVKKNEVIVGRVVHGARDRLRF